MRILRNLLYIVAVVAGILLASANMEPVRFVYLPGILSLTPAGDQSLQVPLALLLLGGVLLGALVTGTGTFVEHVRLRFQARRSGKVIKGLRAELDKARAEIVDARAALDARSAELEAEQGRVRRAEEAESRALASAAEERAKAEEATRQPVVPSGEESAS